MDYFPNYTNVSISTFIYPQPMGGFKEGRKIMELLPHQHTALDFLWEPTTQKHRCKLLAMYMGLGKSCTALEYAKQAMLDQHEIIILCPAYLRYNWANEVLKHGHYDKIDIVSHSRMSQDNYLRLFHEKKLIISDEFHFYKNPKSQRTKAIIEVAKQYPELEILCLTGTPIKRDASDTFIYFLLNGKVKLNQFGMFCAKYCNKVSTFVRGKLIVSYNGIYEFNKVGLRKALSAFTFFMDDSALNLPEIVEETVFLPVPKNVDKELEKEFNESSASAKNKRLNAVLKTQVTIEFVKDLLEQFEQIVVFSDHVESAELIATATKGKVIHGGITTSNRNDIINDFIGGGFSVLSGTIGSMSTGINLVNSCCIVFNDLSWSEADNSQAKKRIHRIGQSKTCYYYYVDSSPIDSKINSKIREKVKAMEIFRSKI